MIFLGIEELIFIYHLSREGDEKEKYISLLLINAFFSFYSSFTLSYIGIYVAGLTMLKTLIILVRKRMEKDNIF